MTTYTGVDAADQTFTALAFVAGKASLASLKGCAKEPGFSTVLYDMWRNQRPFFLEVSDCRNYRRKSQRSYG